jgi:hypothetical protein
MLLRNEHGKYVQPMTKKYFVICDTLRRLRQSTYFIYLLDEKYHNIWLLKFIWLLICTICFYLIIILNYSKYETLQNELSTNITKANPNYSY